MILPLMVLIEKHAFKKKGECLKKEVLHGGDGNAAVASFFPFVGRHFPLEVQVMTQMTDTNRHQCLGKAE